MEIFGKIVVWQYVQCVYYVIYGAMKIAFHFHVFLIINKTNWMTYLCLVFFGKPLVHVNSSDNVSESYPVEF